MSDSEKCLMADSYRWWHVTTSQMKVPSSTEADKSCSTDSSAYCTIFQRKSVIDAAHSFPEYATKLCKGSLESDVTDTMQAYKYSLDFSRTDRTRRIGLSSFTSLGPNFWPSVNE